MAVHGCMALGWLNPSHDRAPSSHIISMDSWHKRGAPERRCPCNGCIVPLACYISTMHCMCLHGSRRRACMGADQAHLWQVIGGQCSDPRCTLNQLVPCFFYTYPKRSYQSQSGHHDSARWERWRVSESIDSSTECLAWCSSLCCSMGGQPPQLIGYTAHRGTFCIMILRPVLNTPLLLATCNGMGAWGHGAPLQLDVTVQLSTCLAFMTNVASACTRIPAGRTP